MVEFAVVGQEGTTGSTRGSVVFRTFIIARGFKTEAEAAAKAQKENFAQLSDRGGVNVVQITPEFLRSIGQIKLETVSKETTVGRSPEEQARVQRKSRELADINNQLRRASGTERQRLLSQRDRVSAVPVSQFTEQRVEKTRTAPQVFTPSALEREKQVARAKRVQRLSGRLRERARELEAKTPRLTLGLGDRTLVDVGRPTAVLEPSVTLRPTLTTGGRTLAEVGGAETESLRRVTGRLLVKAGEPVQPGRLTLIGAVREKEGPIISAERRGLTRLFPRSPFFTEQVLTTQKGIIREPIRKGLPLLAIGAAFALAPPAVGIAAGIVGVSFAGATLLAAPTSIARQRIAGGLVGELPLLLAGGGLGRLARPSFPRFTRGEFEIPTRTGDIRITSFGFRVGVRGFPLVTRTPTGLRFGRADISSQLSQLRTGADIKIGGPLETSLISGSLRRAPLATRRAREIIPPARRAVISTRKLLVHFQEERRGYQKKKQDKF